MAVVYDDIRPPSLIVDNVDAFQVITINFFPVDRAPQEAMSKHAKFDEWQRNAFREENFAY